MDLTKAYVYVVIIDRCKGGVRELSVCEELSSFYSVHSGLGDMGDMGDMGDIG